MRVPLTCPLISAFPDFNFCIEEIYTVEDRVIFWIVFTGTHEGDLSGMPATGNKVEFSTIFISRIENGKVVEEKLVPDLLRMMQQLGMELKPKEKDK